MDPVFLATTRNHSSLTFCPLDPPYWEMVFRTMEDISDHNLNLQLTFNLKTGSKFFYTKYQKILWQAHFLKLELKCFWAVWLLCSSAWTLSFPTNITPVHTRYMKTACILKVFESATSAMSYWESCTLFRRWQRRPGRWKNENFPFLSLSKQNFRGFADFRKIVYLRPSDQMFLI